MLHAYSGRCLAILPNFIIETSKRETPKKWDPPFPIHFPLSLMMPGGPGPSLATDFIASYSGPSWKNPPKDSKRKTSGENH